MPANPVADAGPERWVVATEFSTVVLTLSRRQGVSTVTIEDANSGARATLDALDLEILARSSDAGRETFYRQVMQMDEHSPEIERDDG